jgi:rRNA biogenesis protein RRP5
MPGKKREREEAEPSKKPKKIKFTSDEPKLSSKLAPEEVDFPRGGGSAFTPLEYKKMRSEAIREADAELVFEVSLAFICLYE